MITHLYNDESTASRCLDLIERCAPVAMRTNGGALPREEKRLRTATVRLTPLQQEKILALANSGKFTAAEIADAVGTKRTATYKLIERRGIKVPDGRGKSNQSRPGNRTPRKSA